MRRARVLAAAAGLLAGLVPAGPAMAFTPPELFVRMQTWDTHEAASDWIPLAGAPALDYVGGYEIGYRLQPSGEPNELQRVALTVAAVPDGRPTQPGAAAPYCVTRAGAVGTITAAGPELQFEGDGTYTVTVAVGAGSGGAADCLAGPATTASFSVVTRVAPEQVGEPLTFRATPLPGSPFVGVRAPAPPGGQADVRCALDATVQPDGSVTGRARAPGSDDLHSEVPELVFPRPGAWTCVARGAAEGQDDARDIVVFGTPWSPPLAVEVRSDFRRRTGAIARARSRRPRFRFRAEWPAEARGGRGTVTLYRFKGCRGDRARLRRVSSAGGRFGARRMQLRLRRPRAPGFYVGRFTFSGTRYVRAGDDPDPMRLQVRRNRLEYVPPLEFPSCA